MQTTFIAAAEAAGVYRFVLDDFGWGEEVRGLPEFDTVQEQRKGGWGYARGRADANPGFTWSGVSSGNPIDWVSFFPDTLRKDRRGSCRWLVY